MNSRLSLLVVLLIGMVALPASASLTKVIPGTPVFIGETGLDISSGLLGARQIAWWPAGNDTSTPPGKVLSLTQSIHSFNITPADFSGFEGKWYTYDIKPNVAVFDVKKPEFTLRVWDIDNDRDVTGQTVPQGTRITYRIDTNLYPVLNKYNRPDVTSLDLFVNVALKAPNGKDILYIYTGSAGVKDAVILPVEDRPFIKASPYYWKYGGDWNRTARGGGGDVLYPMGTYTFSATQNLNKMRLYYGDKEGITISGPKTITFVADQPIVPTTGVTTVPTTALTGAPTMSATKTPAATTVPATMPTKKPTWTSSPVPAWIPLVGLVVAAFWMGYRRNRN